MYKRLALVITILFVTACKSGDTTYEPGTYMGQGKGYGQEKGGIYLKVSINENGEIDQIVAEAKDETPTIGGEAIAQLTKEAIEKNSADLDVVSGATLTSQGFIDALQQALNQAKMD